MNVIREKRRAVSMIDDFRNALDKLAKKSGDEPHGMFGCARGRACYVSCIPPGLRLWGAIMLRNVAVFPVSLRNFADSAGFCGFLKDVERRGFSVFARLCAFAFL